MSSQENAPGDLVRMMPVFDIRNCGPRNRFVANGRLVHNSGRTLQTQNLKRPTMRDPDGCAEWLLRDRQTWSLFYGLDDLGSLVRSAIKAPKGYLLVVADLGSIESRVLGWMAGEERINSIFRDGLDTYKSFATEWLGVPYDEVTKQQRFLCKPPTLGCGYGLGAAGLVRYADGMGVEMDEDTAQSAVTAFRTAYPRVPQLWYAVERAAKEAILHLGRPFGVQGQFIKSGRFLRIRLPSGRCLYYDRPDVDDEGIGYWGQNSFTHKWERIRTWGSRLVENITQAVARDVLAVGLQRYNAAGGSIVFHVHDEIVGLEREDKAEEWLEVLIKAMTDPIPWAPNLLLGASGYVSQRYRKD